jgi:porin
MTLRDTAIAGILAATIGLAMAPGARAASGDGLLGDWGGWKSRLADEGIDVGADYTAEEAWNPLGGKRQGARHADQWKLDATFDMARLAHRPGAKLYVSVTQRDGRNLSADTIGNEVQVQEIHGDGQTFRLSDLWYQQTFAAGHAEVRFGRVHPGDDFAYAPCDYQNLAFCARPYPLLVDAGWIDFPASVWGGRIKFMSGPWYAETGAYQVDPEYQKSGHGWDLDFGGTTGVLVPAEIGVLPRLGDQRLPGSYKIGVYYDSSDAPDLFRDVRGGPAASTGLPPLMHGGRYGGYFMAQQQVTQRTPGSAQGISVFLDATLGDRGTAPIRDSLSLGAWYKGPFASRPVDQAEVAIGRFAFNPRLADAERLLEARGTGAGGVQGAETDLIAQYNAQVTKWLVLGPNLQFIIHPDGRRDIDDALVLGLHANLTF